MIGVYEPMVVLVGGEALMTSRAAHGHPAGEAYHHACYAHLGQAPPPP